MKMRHLFGDGRRVADAIPLIRALPLFEEDAAKNEGASFRLEPPFPLIEVMRWRAKFRDEMTGRPKVDPATGEEIYDTRAHWFTLDNRRLYCLQEAALKVWPKRCVVEVVEVRAGSQNAQVRELRKFRTFDRGRTIQIGSHSDGVPFVHWSWREKIGLEEASDVSGPDAEALHTQIVRQRKDKVWKADVLTHLESMKQDDYDRIEVSKKLSWILRRGAKSISVDIDAEGWVRLRDLLHVDFLGHMSEAKLINLVEQSNRQKRRYEMKECQKDSRFEYFVRASSKRGTDHANMRRELRMLRPDEAPNKGASKGAERSPEAERGSGRGSGKGVGKAQKPVGERSEVKVSIGGNTITGGSAVVEADPAPPAAMVSKLRVEPMVQEVRELPPGRVLAPALPKRTRSEKKFATNAMPNVYAMHQMHAVRQMHMMQYMHAMQAMHFHYQTQVHHQLALLGQTRAMRQMEAMQRMQESMQGMDEMQELMQAMQQMQDAPPDDPEEEADIEARIAKALEDARQRNRGINAPEPTKPTPMRAVGSNTDIEGKIAKALEAARVRNGATSDVQAPQAPQAPAKLKTKPAPATDIESKIAEAVEAARARSGAATSVAKPPAKAAASAKATAPVEDIQAKIAEALEAARARNSAGGEGPASGASQ